MPNQQYHRRRRILKTTGQQIVNGRMHGRTFGLQKAATQDMSGVPVTTLTKNTQTDIDTCKHTDRQRDKQPE